ncbi:alpha/beta fold hydrolase [Streptomyces sp. col6]|uniref:alpha/beta hydrolase family protein n=1 Tax=Streptomyces sp. col6 TaxID=2478958 RepID=UPI0011CECB8C|nr:alpha/beta fold hydrolase [Streptomyces sp. col6]TXR99788.1 alpha/beta fold hydrolase [Streptomyces sp. col6]
MPEKAATEPMTGSELAWTPPPYAELGSFSEHEVTVGDGPLAVPGTMSVPSRQGPGPGVVLLAGGGPFDRDETSGPNKPLKDLAWGLVSRGTTVLRFDKATYVHRDVAAVSDLTMTQEYVPHAVDAVDLLRTHASVDPERVYVLGHSMGGKVAPAVAVAAPTVAGLVIMAGDTQPMHHAAVRVVSYLATVLPDQIPPAVIETFQRQAALVDSAELTPSTPAADLPFGLSAPYWLELRDYDPVTIAAELDKPMLILQGGRDYQVTIDHDLVQWRTGLAGHPQADLRVYEADNHLFFPGTGPSTPADYSTPQHVDPDVISDIAHWLSHHHK